MTARGAGGSGRGLTSTAAGYDYLPGADPANDPYCDGVVAQPGHEIIHVVLRTPRPWRDAFAALPGFMASRGRPISALCAVELRSPEARSFDGFAEFNASYLEVLDAHGLRIDGHNPLARTNVAPQTDPPGEIVMHAFSFTAASAVDGPTFVSAGSGELIEGELADSAIVAPGDLSADGLRQKVRHVMDTMTSRLDRMGVGWDDVTTTDIYTLADPATVLAEVRPRLRSAARHGMLWHPSRPPVAGLDFEMDVRGVHQELVLELIDS